MVISKCFVISVTGDYYFVASNNVKYLCRLKGVLKKNKTKVLVGDFVDVEIDEKELNGLIIKIYPRKNQLNHPKIANIDQIVIVVPCKEPDFSSFLLNKFIWTLACNGFKPLLCFSKSDLVKDNDPVLKIIEDYKKLNFQVSLISNEKKDQKSWVEFKDHLENKISVFTGQSGAGKSTTINSLLNDKIILTKELSKKSGRGKNTTTSTNFYRLNNGLIADTPGFASLDLKGLKTIDLATNIFDRTDNDPRCKFSDCLHLSEKKCFVKDQVENKHIPDFFYLDYVKLVNILKKERG